MKHGRLDWFAPEELDEHQRALYDAILEGPRSSARRAFPMTDPLGRFHGPFNAMLVDPVVGDAAQRLGAAVRYGTTLEGRSRELAILEVARLHASDFEFYAHAAVGRSAGLSDDETLIREVVVSLVERHDLDDALYAHAVEVLGTVVVADLVVLVGFYEYTALALRVFRVPLPEGVEQTFIGPGGPAGS